MHPDGGNLKRRTYLGDGVYVGLTDFGDIVIWTTNGISVTNQIVLEPTVFENLTDWHGGQT